MTEKEVNFQSDPTGQIEEMKQLFRLGATGMSSGTEEGYTQ